MKNILILWVLQRRIFFATTNRQNSVKEITDKCDVIVVCGSPQSSNSNRLRETSEALGIDSYIIDQSDEFDFKWIEGKERLGITSGASVPQVIVDELVDLIRGQIDGITLFQSENIEKGIKFPLPNV